MPRITVTIPESLDEHLEKQSGDGGEFGSKSEVMRHLAERGREADELERELEITENRLEDLRRQMTARDNVEEKVDTLAKRIEDERQARDAPFFIRWYRWWSSRGTVSSESSS